MSNLLTTEAPQVSPEDLPGIFWRPKDFVSSCVHADEPGPTDILSTPPIGRSSAEVDEFPGFPGATREGIEAMRQPHTREMERSERIKFCTALTAGWLAVTALVGTFYVAKPVADMLREPTATETVIEDTLESTFGNRPIFRCLPQGDLDVRPSGYMPIAYGKSGKGWIVGFPLAWADEQACEAFVNFTKDPISYEQATQDPNAKEKLEAAAIAAAIIVHEYKHTAHPHPTYNESDTECFAIDHVPQFLQAAGGENTPEFNRLVTDVAIENTEKAAEENPEYTLKSTCSPHD